MEVFRITRLFDFQGGNKQSSVRKRHLTTSTASSQTNRIYETQEEEAEHHIAPLLDHSRPFVTVLQSAQTLAEDLFQ